MTHDQTSHRLAARLFGIFFILAFTSYGTGGALVASVADNALGLEGVFAGRAMLMIGVFLIAIVHSL